MEARIKKALGEPLDAGALSSFLKELFPIGDSTEAARDMLGALSSRDAGGLVRVLLECRESKEKFARWVFSYIDRDGKGYVTEKELAETRKSFGRMTGLLPEGEAEQCRVTEAEFVEKCRSTPSFVSSWKELRRQTRL